MEMKLLKPESEVSEPQTTPMLIILGLGGTGRSESTSELALRYALGCVASLGCATSMLSAQELDLPMYKPGSSLPPGAQRLLEAVRNSDGLIIASPGYHANVSGLIKNAIDYLEELRQDERQYLQGRAVGCIASAREATSAVATLNSLRSITHSLQGWPTPTGVGLCTADISFDSNGAPCDPKVGANLARLAEEVVTFARWQFAGTVG
jgi:FMN reductase